MNEGFWYVLSQEHSHSVAQLRHLRQLYNPLQLPAKRSRQNMRQMLIQLLLWYADRVAGSHKVRSEP
jgi:hypothetical protein